MAFTSVLRIGVFTWQSFWRNIWLSLVAISIVTLAFLSINVLVILNVATRAALTAVQDKVDISIYLRPEVTPAQVDEVRTFLNALTQVREVRVTSAEEALQQFRQLHQGETAIVASLEELKENPLGASLAVKAKSASDYPLILAAVEQSPHANLILDKNFDDHRTYIETLSTVSTNIRWVGLAATALFVAIALLIVFNTVRVALYTHRKEIAIMKLVGATNWFISSPFVLESILYGLISSFLGITLIFGLLKFVQPYLNQFFGTTEFQLGRYFTEHFWNVFGLEVILTTLLMVVSSSIAIRRYLKV